MKVKKFNEKITIKEAEKIAAKSNIYEKTYELVETNLNRMYVSRSYHFESLDDALDYYIKQEYDEDDFAYIVERTTEAKVIPNEDFKREEKLRRDVKKYNL